MRRKRNRGRSQKHIKSQNNTRKKFAPFNSQHYPFDHLNIEKQTKKVNQKSPSRTKPPLFKPTAVRTSPGTSVRPGHVPCTRCIRRWRWVAAGGWAGIPTAPGSGAWRPLDPPGRGEGRRGCYPWREGCLPPHAAGAPGGGAQGASHEGPPPPHACPGRGGAGQEGPAHEGWGGQRRDHGGGHAQPGPVERERKGAIEMQGIDEWSHKIIWNLVLVLHKNLNFFKIIKTYLKYLLVTIRFSNKNCKIVYFF